MGSFVGRTPYMDSWGLLYPCSYSKSNQEFISVNHNWLWSLKILRLLLQKGFHRNGNFNTVYAFMVTQRWFFGHSPNLFWPSIIYSLSILTTRCWFGFDLQTSVVQHRKVRTFSLCFKLLIGFSCSDARQYGSEYPFNLLVRILLLSWTFVNHIGILKRETFRLRQSQKRLSVRMLKDVL